MPLQNTALSWNPEPFWFGDLQVCVPILSLRLNMWLLPHSSAPLPPPHLKPCLKGAEGRLSCFISRLDGRHDMPIWCCSGGPILTGCNECAILCACKLHCFTLCLHEYTWIKFNCQSPKIAFTLTETSRCCRCHEWQVCLLAVCAKTYCRGFG